MKTNKGKIIHRWEVEVLVIFSLIRWGRCLNWVQINWSFWLIFVCLKLSKTHDYCDIQSQKPIAIVSFHKELNFWAILLNHGQACPLALAIHHTTKLYTEPLTIVNAKPLTIVKVNLSVRYNQWSAWSCKSIPICALRVHILW